VPDSTRWRFSADRWKDNERHAAGQRAEQHRMADYYARLTQQQEEARELPSMTQFKAEPKS
jgi:hypothetical protein